MSFDTQSLIVAFPPSELANLEAYRNLYGATLPITPKRPQDGEAKTLLGHADDAQGTLRAGLTPTTVSASSLTDGRYAVSGYWSLALKEAWENGDVQAEILTADQLNNLRPTSEI